MLHILVADDMPLQVHMLEDSIHQMRPQDEVVTAQNGEEILKIVGEQSIDLVLSDIRMPCMDGLEMLQRLGRVSPDSKVIFITGYALFEYAQQALRQGAVDFLVKPVEASELKKKLDYWDDRFAKDRQAQRAQESEKLALLMQQWLLTPVEQLPPSSAQALERRLSGGWIAAVYFTEAGGIEQVKQGIGAMLECGIDLGSKPCILSLPAEKHLLFIVAEGSARQQDALTALLLRVAEKYDMRIGLCAYQENLARAGYAACGAARRGLDSAFYDGALVGFEGPQARPGSPELARQDELYRLLLADEQDRARSLEAMLTRIEDQRPSASRLMEATVFSIARCVEKLEPAANYRQIVSDFAARMRRVLFWDEYRTLVGDCLRALAGEAERTIESTGDPIGQCILYLQRNYAQQISLEDMARRYFLTPNYFSALFKKRTNQRFVEYLTQLRLERAAEQLRTTDDYVYTITARCGYLDERYFIRQFQKYYHMSPVAYRRLYRRETPD